jgi:hypothetical protein
MIVEVIRLRSVFFASLQTRSCEPLRAVRIQRSHSEVVRVEFILHYPVISGRINYVSNHSSSSSRPKTALYTLSPSSLTTSSVWMLCREYSLSSRLLPSVPSFAEPNTRMWMYPLSTAGNLTLPKRCRPYAELATRTDSKSRAVNDVRSLSETPLTAWKYSGSCSALVRNGPDD